MFYIMYGKNSFSLHEELKKIKVGLGNPEMLAVNTNFLDGRQLSLSQLQDVCNAMPFLHQIRLVVVEGLLERFESKKESGKRTGSSAKSNSALKEWQMLTSYIGKMPSTTMLILIDEGLDAKKNALLKQLSPLAKVKVFSQLKYKELQDWAKGRIIEGGGRAAPGAIRLLADLVGGNLWTMGSEIEKLIAFSQGRLITEEDIRQVTSYAREANIFALVDAIMECRMKEAQQLLHRLLQEGDAPAYVLIMITRQLRLILMAKELNSRMSGQQIMSKLVVSNYVLDILLRQAKAYTVENIRRAYHQVLEADIAIKTGKYDGDLAVDLLVVEMCKR